MTSDNGKRNMRDAIKFGKLILVVVVCSSLGGCDEPQVYGSIGVSSYGGSYGGMRTGTSISIGGRIR